MSGMIKPSNDTDRSPKGDAVRSAATRGAMRAQAARESCSGLDGSPLAPTARGYQIRMRMNDYVGPGHYAWLTWDVDCTSENGAHTFGLLSQACLVCRAVPVIEYESLQ